MSDSLYIENKVIETSIERLRSYDIYNKRNIIPNDYQWTGEE